MRKSLLFMVVLVCSGTIPLSAQTESPPLLVWWTRSDGDYHRVTVEYREVNRRVAASYELAFDGMSSFRVGGARLFGWTNASIPVFDPATNTVFYYPASLPADDDAAAVVSSAVPRPDGQQLAYSVRSHAGTVHTIHLITFSSDPTVWSDTVILEQPTDMQTTVRVLGWDMNLSTLLVYEARQPYKPSYSTAFIWRFFQVRAYDLTTGVWALVGDIDGYAGDLSWFGRVELGLGVNGLTIFNRAGETHHYPPPDLGREGGGTGGHLSFSPDGTRFAYRIARVSFVNEKIWTIVGDIRTGESYVLLEDEARILEELRYGYGTPVWLDNTTLSVSNVVIDVTTRRILRQGPDAFQGVAVPPTPLAASGPAQAVCPGALPSRLRLEIQGRITSSSGIDVVGLPGEEPIHQPESAVFTISSGPFCVDGAVWWIVDFEDETWGRIIEADASSYFVEPS